MTLEEYLRQGSEPRSNELSAPSPQFAQSAPQAPPVSLSEYLRGQPVPQYASPVPERPSSVVPFNPALPPPEQPGFFKSLGRGFSSGVDQFQGLGGSLVSLAGTLAGSDTIKGYGDRYRQQQEQEAEAARGGMPAPVAPWREGGKGLEGFPEWAGYTAGNTIPQIAATVGAAMLGSKLLAGTGAVALGARALQAVPQVLGGASGLSTKAAQQLAGLTLGGATVGTPLAAASMFSSAQEREEAGGAPVDRSDAVKALALAPIYQGLETFGPAGLATTFLNREGRSRLRNAVLGGVKGGIGEAATEPMQTSLEMTFRSDLTPVQKAEQIVDSAAAGGLVGFLFGGASGGLAGQRMPRVDPKTPPEQLAAAVDQALSPSPAPAAPVAPAAPQLPRVMPTPEDVEAPQFTRPPSVTMGPEPLPPDVRRAQEAQLAAVRSDTVLDPRRALQLISALRSGQATPAERMEASRLLQEFNVQGQQIPEIFGPDRVEPQPPAPPERAAGADIAALRQRFDAGDQLSNTELNALAADFASQNQERVAAQEAAPPPTRDEIVDNFRKNLASLTGNKRYLKLGVPAAVTDQESLDRYVLERFNSPRPPQWVQVAMRDLQNPDGTPNERGLIAAGESLEAAKVQTDAETVLTARLNTPGPAAAPAPAQPAPAPAAQPAPTAAPVAPALAPETPTPVSGTGTDFSGRRRVKHIANAPMDRFLPVDQLGEDVARYDFDGGTFGSEGVYLDNTGKWSAGEYMGVGRNDSPVYDVEAQFEKAFVLRPETLDQLLEKLPSRTKEVAKYRALDKQIDAILDKQPSARTATDRAKLSQLEQDRAEAGKAIIRGKEVVAQLKKEGYDGLIVENFPDPAPLDQPDDPLMPYVRKLRDRGVDEYIIQNQIFAFRPERQQIIGETRAVQKQGPEGVDVPELAEVGRQVPGRDAQGREAPAPGPSQAQLRQYEADALAYNEQRAAEEGRNVETAREADIIDSAANPELRQSQQQNQRRVMAALTSLTDEQRTNLGNRLKLDPEDVLTNERLAQIVRERDNVETLFRFLRPIGVDPDQVIRNGKARIDALVAEGAFATPPPGVPRPATAAGAAAAAQGEAPRQGTPAVRPETPAAVSRPRAGAPASRVVSLAESLPLLTPERRAEAEARMAEGDAAGAVAIAQQDGVMLRAFTEQDRAVNANENGLTKAQVEDGLRGIMGRVKNAPAVYVVDNRDDDQSSQNFRDYDTQVQARVNGKPLGYYLSRPDMDKPLIIVVANRHASVETATATLYHEMLGHYGLQQAFGTGLTKLMQNIYDTTPRVREAMAKTNYAQMTPAMQAEEYLVASLESGPISRTILDKLVNFVRSFGRQMGWIKGAYSKAELRAIIDRASRAVTENEGVSPTANVPRGVVQQDEPMARLSFDQMNDLTQKTLGQIWRKGTSIVSREKARGVLIPWTSRNLLTEIYESDFASGGMKLLKAARDAQQAIAKRFINNGLQGLDAVAALPTQYRDMIVNDLIPLTIDGTDPRKPMSQNQHALTGDPAIDKDIIDRHKRGFDAYNRLRRDKHNQVYDDLVSSMEMQLYAHQAGVLYRGAAALSNVPQTFKDSLSDPFAAYQTARGVTDNVKTARDFWRGQLDKLMDQIDAQLKAQGAQFSVETNLLAGSVKEARERVAASDRSPYFHIPRFGDYVVSFKVTMQDGRVDPASLDQLLQRFGEEGLFGFEFRGDPKNPSVFIRIDNTEAADKIFAIGKELETKNLVQKDSTRSFTREQVPSELMSRNAQLVERLIQQLRASQMSEEQLGQLPPDQAKVIRDAQNAAVDNLRRSFMDMLPDTAVAKVLVHRDNVAGYSRDFLRGFAFRTALGARSLANAYTTGQENDAFTSMRKDIVAASYVDPAKARRMQQVVTELDGDRANRYLIDKETWHDIARAINSAYFLALNPAYIATNLLQVPAFAIPYMAKFKGVGFYRASKAVMESLPLALRIANEAYKEGRKVSISRASGALLTDAAMVAAQANESEISDIRGAMFRNQLDSGASSREINRLADARAGTKLDKTLTIASSLSYYSEIVSRLSVVLAANKLGLSERTSEILDNTMFNYGEQNVASKLGRAGILGQTTPVVFAFYQYPAQALERVVREYYKAISPSMSAEEKSEARRFIGYQLGVMTFMAGTLGWPFVYAVAGAIDNLKDIWDRDMKPTNVRQAYREMLADVFGPQVGELFARGAFRAIGVDLSERVGLQGILPFSRLLSDRRDWDDASRDWAREFLGSPFGMGTNIAKGLSKVMKGDIEGGWADMAPTTLKNLTRAYKMNDEGYLNKAGIKLPLTPNAWDIIVQAAGFRPAELAEYQEGKQYSDMNIGVARREAQNIRQKLAVAIERGDFAAQAKWEQEANKFDAANPEMAIMRTFKETLRRRERERDRAAETRTPIGTTERMSTSPMMSRFPNY